MKKFLSTGIFPLVTLMLMGISRFLDLNELGYRDNICLAVIVLQLLILAVPTAFFIKLKGDGYPKRMRLAPIGLEATLIAVLAAVVLILGEVLIRLSMVGLGISFSEWSPYAYYLSNSADQGIVYILFTLVVIPAVFEELLFRSVICAEYESNGAVIAVLLSSLLYAMFGFSFTRFFSSFVCGLVFALVMYMTRSVWSSVITHLLYNLVIYFADATINNIVTKPQSTFFLLFVIGGLFLLALFGLFSESERCFFALAADNANSGYVGANTTFKVNLFAANILSPAFITSAGIFVAVTVFSIFK